jgi:hypothetical protein
MINNKTAQVDHSVDIVDRHFHGLRNKLILPKVLTRFVCIDLHCQNEVLSILIGDPGEFGWKFLHLPFRF